MIRSDGTRVLNYTWRGLGESSVFTNGAPGDASIFGGTVAVDWPTRTQGGVYFTPNVLASGPSGPFTWFGTLAENGAGSTGLLYKRNRYFDPVSGRFTQADPIGLGGGLNLYGFADGDPVNFSDPFGLCPFERTGVRCTLGDLLQFKISIGSIAGIAVTAPGIVESGVKAQVGKPFSITVSKRGANPELADANEASVEASYSYRGQGKSAKFDFMKPMGKQLSLGTVADLHSGQIGSGKQQHSKGVGNVGLSAGVGVFFGLQFNYEAAYELAFGPIRRQ